MTFQLRWKRSALREFAQEWELLDRSDQRRIMDALDDMDLLLKQSPMDVGESRSRENERIFINIPLSVAYHVDFRQHVVTILEAHICKKRT
jgi:hypothetical protein